VVVFHEFAFLKVEAPMSVILSEAIEDSGLAGKDLNRSIPSD
jgi:hypothetical protein